MGKLPLATQDPANKKKWHKCERWNVRGFQCPFLKEPEHEGMRDPDDDDLPRPAAPERVPVRPGPRVVVAPEQKTVRVPRPPIDVPIAAPVPVPPPPAPPPVPGRTPPVPSREPVTAVKRAINHGYRGKIWKAHPSYPWRERAAIAESATAEAAREAYQYMKARHMAKARTSKVRPKPPRLAPRFRQAFRGGRGGFFLLGRSQGIRV